MKKVFSPNFSRYLTRAFLAVVACLAMGLQARADDFDIVSWSPEEESIEVADDLTFDGCSLQIEGEWDEYVWLSTWDGAVPAYFVDTAGNSYELYSLLMNENMISVSFSYDDGISTPGTYTLVVEAGVNTINGVPNPQIEHTFTLVKSTSFELKRGLFTILGQLREGDEDTATYRSVTGIDIALPDGFSAASIVSGAKVQRVEHGPNGTVYYDLDATLSVTTEGKVHVEFTPALTGFMSLNLVLPKNSFRAYNAEGEVFTNRQYWLYFNIDTAEHFDLEVDLSAALPFSSFTVTVPAEYHDVAIAAGVGAACMKYSKKEFEVTPGTDGHTFVFSLAEPYTKEDYDMVVIPYGFFTAKDAEGRDIISMQYERYHSFQAPAPAELLSVYPSTEQDIYIGNFPKTFSQSFMNLGRVDFNAMSIVFPDGTSVSGATMDAHNFAQVLVDYNTVYFRIDDQDAFFAAYGSHLQTTGAFKFVFPAGSVVSTTGVGNSEVIEVSYKFIVPVAAELVGTNPAVGNVDTVDLDYLYTLTLEYNDDLDDDIYYYDGYALPDGFSATDADGNPLEVDGIYIDGNKLLICFRNSIEEGVVHISFPEGTFSLCHGQPVPAADLEWTFYKSPRFTLYQYESVEFEGPRNKYNEYYLTAVTGIRFAPGLKLAEDFAISYAIVPPDQANTYVDTYTPINIADCTLSYDEEGATIVTFPEALEGYINFVVDKKSVWNSEGACNNQSEIFVTTDRGFYLATNFFPKHRDDSFKDFVVTFNVPIDGHLDYILANGKGVPVTFGEVEAFGSGYQVTVTLVEEYSTPGIVTFRLPEGFLFTDDGYGSHYMDNECYIDLPGNEFVVVPGYAHSRAFTVRLPLSYTRTIEHNSDIMTVLIDGKEYAIGSVGNYGEEVYFELAEEYVLPGTHSITLPAGALIDSEGRTSTAATTHFRCEIGNDPDNDGYYYTTDDLEYLQHLLLCPPDPNDPTTGVTIGDITKFINSMIWWWE